MEWNNYDYNGAIFIFGRLDSTVTSEWESVTRVMMSVDSSSSFVYSADIKEIPYTQKTKFDGSACVNNTACKVFNINTFAHRISENIQYRFSGGNHTCYLRFYTSSGYVQANVSVEVHATLNTPEVTIDEENGIINVSRSSKSGSPRYYIEIRRKDRSKVNPEISWQDKDYIHTVVMKGIEGGKYNEGVPHTGFMVRSAGDIAGSGLRTREALARENAGKEAENGGIMLLSTVQAEPTAVTCDADIPFTSTKSVRYQYFVFTAPKASAYHFTQTDGPDLDCTLYSDSDYSNVLAEQQDIGNGNMSFSLIYSMSKGQTVYIKIRDYSRNGQTISLRINTIETQTAVPFTPYSIAPYTAVQLSFYSASAGYVTLYPAKKAGGLAVQDAKTEGGKTPYYVLTAEDGTNKYGVYNVSADTVTYWLTDLHSDIDYQPYWRINPVTQFKACVIFDNAEIEKEYGEYCISQVEDALTRLSNIISEASGNSVTFKIENKGVSKLYVSEALEAEAKTGRYINSSGKIASGSAYTLYFAAVSDDSVYRISYEHDDLYYAKAISTATYTKKISDNSSYLWYEDIGGDYGADENTLVVQDGAQGYYVISNSPFSLERVVGSSDCSQAYHDEYAYDYNITVRFGLDGTTWIGNQGTATSGGYSADINGQGRWINWLYHDSSSGVEWSYAIINVDNSDVFETLFHVIHEEIAQSLGIGDDCYSHEESIHWDPEYANPDWYTGIDRTILDFAYSSNKNGYTQFDLCNEYDLPITLFREYSDYNSSTGSYQFRLKDAGGSWLLRSGEYDVYAWCAGEGESGGISGGSGNEGWDDDPYSLRSEAVSFTVHGGWYWLDYGIDMKNGSKKLKTADVDYTVWNAFVDAVADVMGSGTIPDDSANYGSAACLCFSEGIAKAKLTDTDKTLYAQKFNTVNYIINARVPTGIGVQKSLTSQVLAEHMEKLQDCRNLM